MEKRAFWGIHQVCTDVTDAFKNGKFAKSELLHWLAFLVNNYYGCCRNPPKDTKEMH